MKRMISFALVLLLTISLAACDSDSENQGVAGSVDDIKSVLPESAVLSENIFDVYEEDAGNSQKDIDNWMSEIGY